MAATQANGRYSWQLLRLMGGLMAATQANGRAHGSYSWSPRPWHSRGAAQSKA